MNLLMLILIAMGLIVGGCVFYVAWELSSGDFEHKWQKKYIELKAFKEEHGHASPPQSHPSLGNWCIHRRQEYKKSKLSKERIKLLESIGFKWTLQ